jgi:hypothetical protein
LIIGWRKISRDFRTLPRFSVTRHPSLEAQNMCQWCVGGDSLTVTLQPFVYRGCAVVSVFGAIFVCLGVSSFCKGTNYSPFPQVFRPNNSQILALSAFFR